MPGVYTEEEIGKVENIPYKEVKGTITLNSREIRKGKEPQPPTPISDHQP
jgi:hypothetical protein